MNTYLNSSYITWTTLISYVVFVVLFIMLLKYIDNTSKRYQERGIIWKPKFLMNLAFNLKTVLEPLFLLIFIGLFISINIWIHSIITIIVTALLFQYLNSYFIGKFYILKGKLQIGNKIESGEINGQIISFNLFGIELRDGDNLHYMLYNQIIKDGFKTLPNQTSIIEVNLKLRMNEDMKKPQWIKQFRLFLFDIPFINTNLKPEISADYQKEIVNLKLMLNEGVKEKHFTDLLVDNGFELTH